MKPRKLFLTLSSILPAIVIPFFVNAQFVDFGTDPASIKWLKTETEHYSVIYPENYRLRALNYVYILEKTYPHGRKTMQSKRRAKIPVVLHPYNVQSNGMVVWAPKRMELLPTPDLDKSFGLTDIGLTLHESRHAAQLDRLNQGFLRPFYFVFGEQTMGLSSVFIPKWFFEGDAVSAETGLSSTGRGRQADFLMPYRAQASTGKFFSFDKWFMGSYKDFTHTYYAMGYAMTAYARSRSGADVWNNVLDDATFWRGFPPFAGSLKRNTGLLPKQLFDATFDALRKDRNESAERNNAELKQISERNADYTDYDSPVQTGDRVIAIKRSLRDINSIVSVDKSGNEKRLAYIGNINSKLSVANGRVYWSEYLPGLRREHKNRSVVKQLNPETGKIRTIAPRQRFFAPSAAGDRIAVYNPTPEGTNNIKIIDTVGNELNTLSVINNDEVKDLALDTNGDLFVSAVGDAGNMLVKTNVESGDWIGLLRPLRTNIGSLRLYEKGLLFESGFNGTSNIYSFDTMSCSVENLTGVKFGASKPSVTSDNKLLFADYTAEGYRIVTAEVAPEPVKFENPYKFKFAETLSLQEGFNADTMKFEPVSYSSTRYARGLNLFNFHSRMPLYVDVDNVTRSNDFDLSDAMPGVTVMSQNRLNTFVSTFAYYYDYVNNFNHGNIFMRYTGWFPVLELKVDVGGSRGYIYKDENPEPSSRQRNPEVKADFSMYVPLNFTRDHYFHGLQPFLGYHYENNVVGRNSGSDFQYFDGGIYYYRYRRLAVRDIFPRFGLQLWLRFAGQPYIDVGKLYLTKASFYLPGIVANHGLRLRAEYQFQDVRSESLNQKYPFPLRIVGVPRGCVYYYINKQYFTGSIDYSFPIAYPDMSLGSIVYLQRIRADLFCDAATGRAVTGSEFKYGNFRQWSYGAELLFPANFLRIQYMPVSLGLQAGKSCDKKFFATFLFGVTF